jgi:hypothetical protein
MSYKVLLDGEVFCASFTEETAILEPKVKLEANKAGSFTFRMLPDHPYYDALQLRASILDVYQGDELIFEGVPVSIEVDFWKRKKVTCEGELTFLNDSILRQLNPTHKTVSELLGYYLEKHNSQMNNWKQFQLGTVTVGTGVYVNRYTNYNTTLSQIAEDLVNDFGGFLRVRHDQGVRYLDYLAASPHTSSQVVRIGKNLTDLKTNLDTLDIATVLIPLGAKTGEKAASGADKRVTVKTVNNDNDYIVSTASAYYGYIWKTKTWQDVTVPANLLTRGENYLTDAQWANLTIEASALDLGLVEADVEQFRLLDTIRVVSEPHGIDRNFILSKLDIDLNHPGNTRITLGMSASTSMSSQVAEASQEIENTPTMIDVTAREQARQLLESATGGNIYFVYDADGVCTEIRIMDTNDPNTATKIWRWNINGWGYSGDGGQTYTVAATMNGAIVADFITAGTLRGVQIIGESGTIGGWKMTGSILEKYSNYTDGVPTTVYRAYMSAPSSPADNYIAFGIEVYDWDGSTLTLNSQPFKVRYDGKLTASGADIEGTIKAISGSISGDLELTGSLKGTNTYGKTVFAPTGLQFLTNGNTFKGGIGPYQISGGGFGVNMIGTDGAVVQSTNGQVAVEGQTNAILNAKTQDAQIYGQTGVEVFVNDANGACYIVIGGQNSNTYFYVDNAGAGMVVNGNAVWHT